MKFSRVPIYASLILAAMSCSDQANTQQVKPKAGVETVTDASGFSYETVANDPTGLRLYTLKNGLKVYLSQNDNEPKIQTFIAVRAGSNYDPKESTGLAHYLEHMVFKGTSHIGTSDWEQEKVFLKQISDLYEEHKKETDPQKKLEIYKKIDEISLEASKHSIANEYDKMVGSLGATGTNAHTWFEETVYKNKIPANELEKWLKLETERFSELTLRLFHTELEAVFEEFNRGQDNDYRKAYAAMLDGLFPNHPYGQQTTIGVADHLKNPSMEAIHNYFNKYYVPNNMAMVLVGDLNFDETIKKIDQTFGTLKRKEVVHPTLPKEEPITAPIVREVYGPTPESIGIGFRSDGTNSKDEIYLTLCDMILANGSAGLLDLNLNQKKAVQYAGCSPTFLNDYGYHSFNGSPKADQSLDEVKDLILAQIEKLKKGEFEDWMLEAVVNDLKLSRTQQYENSTSLARDYYNAFIHHNTWEKNTKFLDELKKVTKKELVDFANAFYKDNYVVVYKRQGEDKSIVKVQNPGITPVELNRDKKSTFLNDFNAMNSGDLQPKYVDYQKSIKKLKTKSGLDFSYIINEKNDLFDLNIIFDMGKDHNKKLSLAVGYLEFLGTDKYSAEELKKEFYKLGISYYVSAGADKSYVGLDGLKENLEKGLELLEHLWSNAVVDQEAYNRYVQSIQKQRVDGKAQKGNIMWNGMMSFAKYGENSRLRNIFSSEELSAINPQELIDLVKDLKNFKQRIFYYGKDQDKAMAAVDKLHKTSSELKDYPKPKEYQELETDKKVYFVDFDMVQAEMLFIAKGNPFDVNNMAASYLFNSYFGSGLSSIVFQEIRESKSLAYSAFAGYNNASKVNKSDYVTAYIGTQANKMEQAVNAMMDLMENMPEAEEQFNAAKESALKKIAAQRITKSKIFWNYESLQKRGIFHDNRKDIYEAIKGMTMEDLRNFFNTHIKGEQYNVLVMGNKKDVDMKVLKKLGTVKELDLDYLFNY
ncbi:MAG: M16 family metallopeptidase [Flavobacteriales bacterium]